MSKLDTFSRFIVKSDQIKVEKNIPTQNSEYLIYFLINAASKCGAKMKGKKRKRLETDLLR